MKGMLRGLLCLVLVLFASSCIADRSRATTLMPAVTLAWPGVHADIDRGIADGVEDGDVDAAVAGALNLEAGRLDNAVTGKHIESFAAINWYILQPYAFRGIEDRVDDGELSPEAAESFNERIWRFADALEGLGTIVPEEE